MLNKRRQNILMALLLMTEIARIFQIKTLATEYEVKPVEVIETQVSMFDMTNFRQSIAEEIILIKNDGVIKDDALHNISYVVNDSETNDTLEEDLEDDEVQTLVAIDEDSNDVISEIANNSIPVYTFGDAITSITEEEFELLSHLIVAEAENQSLECQKAVAQVVFNRVLSKDFPDTITGVIYQNYAFSCIKDGRFDRTASNEKSDIALKSVINERKVLPSNVLFFSSDRVHTEYSVYYTKIDDMLFSTPKK